MRDIGLDIKTAMLTDSKPNVIPLIRSYSTPMDDAYMAIMIHVQNLIATYGRSVVSDVVKDQFKDEV